MTQETLPAAPAKDTRLAKRAALAESAKQVDRIATAGAVAMRESAGSFEHELVVAQAMVDLDRAITPDMMAPIMALMNNPLGFLTDRDPARGDQPYPETVVRRCFIESKLRGFHAVGNEWNIIGGRFYAAKSGLERLVRTHPAICNLREEFSVPKPNGPDQMIVSAKATWEQDGNPQELDAEIPIRLNKAMGVDAVLGKAARKLYARILARVAGTVVPEGDAIEVEATVTPGVSEPTANPLEKTTRRRRVKDEAPEPPAPAAPANDLPHSQPTPNVETGSRVEAPEPPPAAGEPAESVPPAAEPTEAPTQDGEGAGGDGEPAPAPAAPAPAARPAVNSVEALDFMVADICRRNPGGLDDDVVEYINSNWPAAKIEAFSDISEALAKKVIDRGVARLESWIKGNIEHRKKAKASAAAAKA